MNIDCDCSIFVFLAPLETAEFSSSGSGEERQISRVGGSGAADIFVGASRRSPDRSRSRLFWPVESRQPFRIHDNGQANGPLATCMAGTSGNCNGEDSIGYLRNFWSCKVFTKIAVVSPLQFTSETRRSRLHSVTVARLATKFRSKSISHDYLKGPFTQNEGVATNLQTPRHLEYPACSAN